jgi:carbonic anhydrase
MKPGHLFIQRNIGNVAPIHDWNFATVLEYAIKHLKVRDIVICGHSDCGAIKALDKELDDVYIPLWLNNAIEAKNRVDSKIKKPATPEETKKRSRMIEQENDDGFRLSISKPTPDKTALKQKAIEVHGLYYDLETGLNKNCNEITIPFQSFFIRPSDIRPIRVTRPSTRMIGRGGKSFQLFSEGNQVHLHR